MLASAYVAPHTYLDSGEEVRGDGWGPRMTMARKMTSSSVTLKVTEAQGLWLAKALHGISPCPPSAYRQCDHRAGLTLLPCPALGATHTVASGCMSPGPPNETRKPHAICCALPASKQNSRGGRGSIRSGLEYKTSLYNRVNPQLFWPCF